MQQQLLATPAQIPDDIARLAHEQKLGTPQGKYAILELARDWCYFILCSALSAEAILLVISVILLSQRNYTYLSGNTFSLLNF